MSASPDYANCWEDADLLLKAFGNQRGGRLISIASAGDNTLSLLSLEPKSIIALDRSLLQLALLELKITAAANLDYDDFLTFLGFRPGRNRWDLYSRIRERLSSESRILTDRWRKSIEAGLIHRGRLERIFRFFRTGVMPLLWRRELINGLFRSGEDQVSRSEIERELDRPLWKVLMKVFLNERVVSAIGRDAGKLRFAEGSLSEMLQDRIRHVMLNGNPAENPYLHYILCGKFGSLLPHYAGRENYRRIRECGGTIRLVQDELDRYLERPGPGKFTGFNLSDVFEYIGGEETNDLFSTIVATAAPEARLVYWNMMVERQSHHPGIRYMDELSKNLGAEDRIPLYRGFHVEEVT